MSDPGPDAPAASGKIPKTIGYYAAFIALGLVSASLGPTLPGLAEQTRSGLGQVSYLFMGRSSGYLLGSLFGGRLYDRWPGHPLLAGMLAIMALMMALVPLSPFLLLIAAILFVLGLAEGALDVGGNTLLARVHLHNLDPFMNALHFFFGVGALLSPLVVVRVLQASGGIAWAYWTLALAVLPTALWLLPLPSPGVQAVSRDGSLRAPSPLLVAMIAACFFLCVGAEVAFGGWIYTYALRMGLADARTAGYLTSAFWGALTLGRLLGIPVSARFSPRAVLTGDLAGALLSSCAILLWPGDPVALWTGTFCAGLFIATMFATLLNMAQHHMTLTGRVTGWFFVGSSTGGMTIPWLIGQFFEPIGPRVTMFLVVADLVVAVGVFAALRGHVRRLARARSLRTVS